MKRIVAGALLLPLLLLGGCLEDDKDSLPPPVTMTDEALGYYCQMTLSEHAGPKAQIHLVGMENPLFFTQVRDAIAYQRMPEQSARIAAIYVNDMGAAKSWDDPGADNWILADDATYVAGSKAVGGMGAPELVPFSTRSAAEAFAATNGGQVLTLDEVPDDAVLGTTPAVADGGEDHLYRVRLKALTEENGG